MHIVGPHGLDGLFVVADDLALRLQIFVAIDLNHLAIDANTLQLALSVGGVDVGNGEGDGSAVVVGLGLDGHITQRDVVVLSIGCSPVDGGDLVGGLGNLARAACTEGQCGTGSDNGDAGT